MAVMAAEVTADTAAVEDITAATPAQATTDTAATGAGIMEATEALITGEEATTHTTGERYTDMQEDGPPASGPKYAMHGDAGRCGSPVITGSTVDCIASSRSGEAAGSHTQ